eukprot:TRINITY_DN9353_c0_g1_i2.p1 TRINITY_DN9353_c0_g1~~TRINITY_DN9353_c0_g1_i2.p1  ORF type:complete len:468 (-),score=109.01 TRINITY_DN9353_c0_g1_i2:35-1282(-)
MADFGYDVSNYVDVDPLFGNLQDFQDLIAQAHARSLKVIVDYVPNHTSDVHPWFIESKSGPDSPKRDWYIWRKGNQDGPPNNWASVFGGKSWEKHGDEYYMHSFLAEQPDLNWRNPDVVREMKNVLQFWLDLGVDGFRMDAIRRIFKDDQFRDNPPSNEGPKEKGNPEYDAQSHIYDMYRPEIHDMLLQFRHLLDSNESKDRKLAMVAEVWGDSRSATTFFGDADQKHPEFHLVFNFRMMHIPWDATSFRSRYEEFLEFTPKDCLPAIVLGSHDEHRLATRFGCHATRNACLMLMTLRGSPTVYNGDEIGMEDVEIPDDKIQDPWAIRTNMPSRSRDPGRTPMQWNSDPSTSFGFTQSGIAPWLPCHRDASTINVEHQRSDLNSLLSFYKKMIHHRKNNEILRLGTYHSIRVNSS